MIFAGLLIAQLMSPPPNLAPPAPLSVSERAVLDKGLADAQMQAQSLGGLLGASITDLTTGVTSDVNGEQPFSMAEVQRLPLAVLVYRGVDAGTLSLSQSVELPNERSATLGQAVNRMLLGDDASAEAVMRILRGADAINAALHALNFDGIFVEAGDGGYASPDALAHFLSEVTTGTLLSTASNDALLATLANAANVPEGMRAGLPHVALLQQMTGTLVSGGVARVTNDVGIAHIPGHVLLIVAMLRDAVGTQRQRDAVLAQVARTAVAAATATPAQ